MHSNTCHEKRDATRPQKTESKTSEMQTIVQHEKELTATQRKEPRRGGGGWGGDHSTVVADVAIIYTRDMHRFRAVLVSASRADWF